MSVTFMYLAARVLYLINVVVTFVICTRDFITSLFFFYCQKIYLIILGILYRVDTYFGHTLC